MFDLQVCVLRLLRKTSQEPFLALDFLFLGEDNAFLPLSVDNQIRVFRRLPTELQRGTLRCAFSSGFVIHQLPSVLSHLVVSLCYTTLLFHR